MNRGRHLLSPPPRGNRLQSIHAWTARGGAAILIVMDLPLAPPRAALGGRILPPGQLSALSVGSLLSFLSVGSILSAASILSIGSVGSVLSIGSSGSILSIGSAGSILSIGSAGSIGSIGCTGAVFGRRREPPAP